LLAELEAEDVERHATMAYLRRRLGRSAGEAAAAPLGGSITPSGTVSLSVNGREPSVPGRIRSDAFFRMTIPEAVKGYLGIMKQPQGPKAIMEGVISGGLLTNAKNFYTTLWTALKRMESAGEVVNTPNGWGLAEWYPSRPKGPDDGKKAKTRKGP